MDGDDEGLLSEEGGSMVGLVLLDWTGALVGTAGATDGGEAVGASGLTGGRVGGMVVGGSVGAPVVGAAVVGAGVVGAAVVGGTVMGATVVGAIVATVFVVGAEVMGGEVGAGTTDGGGDGADVMDMECVTDMVASESSNNRIISEKDCSESGNTIPDDATVGLSLPISRMEPPGRLSLLVGRANTSTANTTTTPTYIDTLMINSSPGFD